ncbi:MAG: outer membrane lipoprotein-sorting protein [Candidatus Riflebacteria bacterium]
MIDLNKVCGLCAFFLALTIASPAQEIASAGKEITASSTRVAATPVNQGNSEILLAIDRALNPESYVSYKKIINIDNKGVRKEFVMYVGKLGRDKVLGAFLSPKSELGRATLRIGDNMWLYIPNVKKPVRITSLQSVTGGLFNNSDIMSLDYADEYDCIEVSKKEGKNVLELRAKNRSVAYERLVIVADPESHIPESIECFTSSKMLVKTLHFKEIVDFEDGLKRPSVIETDSPLYKGAKSIMIYSKMKRQKLDEELFNINSMNRYKDLR